MKIVSFCFSPVQNLMMEFLQFYCTISRHVCSKRCQSIPASLQNEGGRSASQGPDALGELYKKCSKTCRKIQTLVVFTPLERRCKETGRHRTETVLGSRSEECGAWSLLLCWPDEVQLPVHLEWFWERFILCLVRRWVCISKRGTANNLFGFNSWWKFSSHVKLVNVKQRL